MISVKMDDFKKEGGGWDFDAYHRAQIAVGEKCRTCGGYIVWAKGYPSQCHDCESIQNSDAEVTHDSRIRCPKCRATSRIDDRYRLYEDGEHDVSCNECDHDFVVSTSVSYSFRSPALLPDDATSE